MEKIAIWVDADSFPLLARDIILKTAVRLNLNVIYVGNRNIPFSIKCELFSMRICEKSLDSADNYIYENVKKGDLVATRDIPLADRLVKKGICTINDRGKEFTTELCETMLAERNLSLMLSQAGVNLGKKFNTYGKKEALEFSKCLDRVLEKLCK